MECYGSNCFIVVIDRDRSRGQTIKTVILEQKIGENSCLLIIETVALNYDPRQRRNV